MRSRLASNFFLPDKFLMMARGAFSLRTTVRRQAETCLANLVTILGVYGFELRDVRHLRIYVAGDEAMLLDAWTGVRSFFDENAPPATLLGVNGLGYDGQVVEIEASVVRD